MGVKLRLCFGSASREVIVGAAVASAALGAAFALQAGVWARASVPAERPSELEGVVEQPVAGPGGAAGMPKGGAGGPMGSSPMRATYRTSYRTLIVPVPVIRDEVPRTPTVPVAQQICVLTGEAGRWGFGGGDLVSLVGAARGLSGNVGR